MIHATLPIYGAGAALFAVAAYYAPPLAMRWLQARALRGLSPGRVALTYDDGPDRDMTPPLLDLLRARDARATFFLVGERARVAPDVCDRIQAEGHEVATHSQGHRNAWKIGPRAAVADAVGGYRELAPWVRGNALFRPPFGKTTTPVMVAMLRRRASVLWWTDVAGDTYEPLPDVEAVAERIVQRGGVVLMHSRHLHPARRAFTLRLTALVLDEGAGAGIEFCTVSEFRRTG